MLGIEPSRPYIDAPDVKSSNMSVQTMNPFQDQGGQNFGSVAPMPPKNGIRRQQLWSGSGGGGMGGGMGGGAGNGVGVGGGGLNRNYVSGRSGEMDMDCRLQGPDYSAVLDRGQVPVADPFRPSGGGLSSGGGLPSGGGLARYHSAPGSFLASLAADFQQDSALSSFFADADLPSLNTASDSSMDNMETEPSTSGLFDDEFLVDTRKFERRGNSQLSPGNGGAVVAQKPLQSVYKHSMEVLHENPMGVEQISSSGQISSSTQMTSTTQMSSGLILQGSIPSSMGLVQTPLSSSPQAGQKVPMSGLSGNRPGSNASAGQQANMSTHLAGSPGHLTGSPTHLANSPSHLATSPKAGHSPLGLNNHIAGGSPGPQMGQSINMGNRLTGSVNFSGGLNSDFGVGIPSPASLGGLAGAGRSNSLLRQSSSPAGLLAQLTIDVPPATLTKTEKQSLSSPLAHSPDDSLSGGTSEDNSANHGMMSGMDIGGWEDVASSYMKSWSNDTFSMRKRYRDNMDLGDIIVPADTPGGGSSLDHGPLPGSLTRHMSLPTTKPKPGGVSTEDLLQSVPCRIRAKRGCATHPRSIAERVRRTRISERMRKLQELVPNMDKQQTNTADMLDEAVEYVKQLQRQVQELTENAKKCNGSCHQELKNSVS